MISLVNDNNRKKFIQACEEDPVPGSLIMTDYFVYNKYRDCDFYVAVDQRGYPVAALSRMDGQVRIAAGAHYNLEEILDFLHVLGDYNQVFAMHPICRALCGHDRFFSAPVMHYNGGPFQANYSAIVTEIKLDPLYFLNCAVFPGFSAGISWRKWYTGTSYLFRHSLGFAAGIYEYGRLVSCGGVYAMTSKVGLIANIATLPPYRGKGYAQTVVQYLCDQLISTGRIPALQCAEESLAAYYGKIGFTVQDRWGKIFRED